MKLSLSALLAATLLASSATCAPLPFSDDAENALVFNRKVAAHQARVDARNRERWREGYADFFERTALEPTRNEVRVNRPERDMSHMTDRQLIDSIIEDRNLKDLEDVIYDDSYDDEAESNSTSEEQSEPSQQSKIWTSEAEKVIADAAGRMKMEFRRTAGSITKRIDNIRVSLLRASLLVD